MDKAIISSDKLLCLWAMPIGPLAREGFIMARALPRRSVLTHLGGIALGVLALIAPSSGLNASPPYTAPIQGFLSSTEGVPANGVVSLVFRLYTEPVGGIPLASETRLVTVTEGLYDVHLDTLGNPDLYRDPGGDNENWYFGISVAGEAELVPRIRIGTVPFAHMATGVEGDVHTSPGRVTVRVRFEPTKHHEIVLLSEPDSAVVVVLDSNKTTAATGRYVMKAGIPIRTAMTLDHDGDGESDGEIESSMVPGTSAVAIKTKGTGADKDRVHVTTTVTPDSGKYQIDHDSDEDGLPEEDISFSMVPGTSAVAIKVKGTGADRDRVHVTTTVTPDSGKYQIDHDSDEDGLPEEDISFSMVPGTSAVAIKVKGTGADRDRVHVTTTVTPDSGKYQIDHDSDEDGLPEEEISFSMIPGTSAVAIKWKGTGADANRVVIQSDTGGAQLEFLDSGATAVAAMSHRIVNDGGGKRADVSMTLDEDGDGTDEGEVSYSVLPGTCSVAIKTKGTGADANRVISTTHPDSAVHVLLSADSKESVAMRVYEGGGGAGGGSSSLSLLHDDGLAGSTGVEVSSDAIESALNLMDDGLVSYRVSSSSGMQLHDGSGVVTSSIDRDGVASFALRLGVGTVATTHPIEHSSGAHLTAGGTWTNASPTTASGMRDAPPTRS